MNLFKIKDSQKRRKFGLIFCIIWFVIILAQILSSNQSNWFDYLVGIFGFLTTIFYLIQYGCPYLIIKDGVLQTEVPFGKKIELKEVIQIKSFANDLILKGTKKDVYIHLTLIDENDIEALKNELKNLDAKWV